MSKLWLLYCLSLLLLLQSVWSESAFQTDSQKRYDLFKDDLKIRWRRELPVASKGENGGVNVTIHPPQIHGLFDSQIMPVFMNVTGLFPANANIIVASGDNEVAFVENGTVSVPQECEEGCHFSFQILVRGVRVGRTSLTVTLSSPIQDAVDGPGHEEERTVERKIYENYSVAIFRQRGPFVKIYLMATAVLLSLLTFGFGCQMDLETLMSIARRPFPPFVGIVCQFGLLPLFGFGLSIALKLQPAFGFGLLTYSCSPGGGMSNVFALMLNGDLTLSLLMTFLSTLLALGMMPMWMALLSSFFVEAEYVVIPYIDIVKALAMLAVPCLLGMAFNRCKPKWGKFVCKGTRYLAMFFIIFQLVANAFVNFYIFGVIKSYPSIIVAVALLPVCGFFGGYGLSFICRQSHPRRITIALETGIQNIAIGIVMLYYAFPQPEGDLGAVIPVAAGYVTICPLVVVLIIYMIYRRMKQEETSVVSDSDYSSCPDGEDPNNKSQDKILIGVEEDQMKEGTMKV